MFLFIALALTLATVIYFWQKSIYTFWTDRGIPQQPARFPLGTIQFDRNFVYKIDDDFKAYRGKAKYVGLYNALQPNLLVLDEELMKHMMVKDFSSFQSRGVYHNERDDPLSGHLFAIEGQKWRGLRNKLSPTFTSGKMRTMCPILIDIAERFKETMDEKIERGEKGIDMRDMFARFTTDVIGTCAFGLECNSLKDPKAKFREIGMKVFNEPRYPMWFQLMVNGFPKLSRTLRIKLISDEVESFFMQAVNDTFEHRIKNNIKRHDFVDLLIDLRNEKKSNSEADSHLDGLSMNEIAAQCFVFFLAGFETSSTVSSFTIYELARNQAVQDKLRAHVQSVLKKHSGQVTYEALKDMTYLEQCINEGMRMYPPVPMLQRSASEDYKLPGTNVVLPKNTTVAFPIYSFHHDPKNYPKPENYDPERFSPQEVAKRHPFAFLPFGEGPRNCIGERFGMMQVKVGMVYLIANYRFTLNSKTQPITFTKEAFVLTPETSLYFDIEQI